MHKTLSLVSKAARGQDLPFLLIGGNAVIYLGFPRLTLDLDLLVPDEKRSPWLDLMRTLGFQLVHGTGAFAQFQPDTSSLTPVDLMFVDAPTWQNLDAEARQVTVAELPVRLPRTEHLIALKLHAAGSPTRQAREKDWEDIRQIVRICQLDPAAPYFREIILRYGGEEALTRMVRYRNET